MNNKSITGWIFISFLTISCANPIKPTYGQTERDSLKFYYFRKGEEYVSQGDTVKAIESFKLAVQEDRKYASAHHRLAQLYLGIGTLECRMQAKWALEKALDLEPKNITYLFTQANYFQKIEAMGMLERIIKKILTIDPEDAEAHFILGSIRERDWFHYEDMVSHQFTADGIYMGTFTMDKFAEKDIARAKMYYKKAILLDPMFSEAYYRLALLYYEEQKYTPMISFLEEALKISPDNKNYHLFLGLAYHRAGHRTKAVQEYKTAASFMNPEEKGLFESIDLICSPSDRNLYQTANPDEKAKIVQTFWNSRDPLFLTEENERILEHYSRVAYADLRFSRYPEGVPGWKTDAGQVIIRYGHPEVHTKTRPDMRCTSAATWTYPGFEFNFEERSLSNRFDLCFKADFNAMIEEIPERYDLVPPQKKFPVVCTVANYQGENNQTILEVYQSIPKTLAYLSNQKKNENTITRGVFLFDRDWNTIQKKITRKPFFYDFEESILLIGWERMHVDSGMYHLVVEYMDDEGKIGRWKKKLLIEDFQQENLSVSDIVLALHIGDYQEEDELRRGGMRIVPNPLEVYPVTSSIPIYFEIYNLSYSPAGETHYRVTFSVESLEEKKDNPDQLSKNLWKADKPSDKVITTYEYTGDLRDDVFFQTLSIDNPQPTDYHFIVEIEDLNSGKKTLRETVIGLRQEEVD
jgi:GWxTD domain-containing protein